MEAKGLLCGWMMMLLAVTAGSRARADPLDNIVRFKNQFGQLDPNVGTFADQYQRDRAENLGMARDTRMRNLQLRDVENRQRQLVDSLSSQSTPLGRAMVQDELARLDAQKQAILKAGQLAQVQHNQRISTWGRKVSASNRPGGFFSPSVYRSAPAIRRSNSVYRKYISPSIERAQGRRGAHIRFSGNR
jgi:hypothetical protein